MALVARQEAKDLHQPPQSLCLQSHMQVYLQDWRPESVQACLYALFSGEVPSTEETKVI